MCIITDIGLRNEKQNGPVQLQLWKVILIDNIIGLWGDTRSEKKFRIGVNTAKNFNTKWAFGLGEFHCFFSREAARDYRKYHGGRMGHRITKIIKVHAYRKDIMNAGPDNNTGEACISVSKLTIKSLKHQR